MASPALKQTERCHPDETRPFQVREYARIQTFPDNWIFEGSISKQYKQIGNAVPVNFAKEIGLSLVNFLTVNSDVINEKIFNPNQRFGMLCNIESGVIMKNEGIELLKECLRVLNHIRNTKYCNNDEDSTTYKLATKIEKYFKSLEK